MTLGCGGDANPQPRGTLELARQYGNEICMGVNDLLRQPLRPLQQKLACRVKPIALPFDTLPTREEWTARAQSTNHWIAYHARKNLARLDRGWIAGLQPAGAATPKGRADFQSRKRWSACRLQIGDTADYKSALRGL